MVAGPSTPPMPTRSGSVRSQLDQIVARLGDVDPVPELWPVYGGLVVNLVNILEAMEEVAAANPLDQPPLPILMRRRRTTGRPPG